MSAVLPINIENLLRHQGVEAVRLECKASWEPDVMGHQVVRTICAFANDVQNLNGGYIVIGVEEKDGKCILPPKGLEPAKIEAAQKWLRGHCNRIDPIYQPVFSPEIIDGRHILVIWTPGSEARPHMAPDDTGKKRQYYIRLGTETVIAQSDMLKQLLELTARVPFDDRRALDARTEDMREQKVREFLRDINSGLLDIKDTRTLYRNMRIARQVNGYDVPINVGLLFFTEDASMWFAGGRIEVVHYATDTGDILVEKIFRGGIHEQLRVCMDYLESFVTHHFEKRTAQFLTHGWVSYPSNALKEALANAVYHRSYEKDCVEPIKVYIYPDRIEIISYPGPVAGVTEEHLTLHKPVPPLPARNRRVGEFLKELHWAEGRNTGLRKIFSAMESNGSPKPIFDFDSDYFRVTLPAHPEYITVERMRV